MKDQKTDLLKSIWEKKYLIAVAFVLLIFVFAAGNIGAGVSSGSKAGIGNSKGESYDTMRESAPTAMRESESTAKSYGVQSQSQNLQFEAQKMIFSADIKIEVQKLDDVFDQIKGIASEFNGYLSDSNTVVYDNRKTGYVTMKVPKDKFYQAIEKAKTFGKLKSENIQGEDVTEEYTDLESRLKNLQATEKRMLAILDKAENVSEILEVERELSNIREQIERLQGRKTYLDNRIDYSTITVSVEEPIPVTEFALFEAFSLSASGFLDSIYGIIVISGALIPFLIIFGIAWIIYRKFFRKK